MNTVTYRWASSKGNLETKESLGLKYKLRLELFDL